MSKNTFWYIVIGMAVVVGALLGPSLSDEIGGYVLILFPLLLIGIIVLVIYSLSGNKGGPRADPAAEADALALRPSPGKGRIYVVRRGFAAALQGMNVAIDDRLKGQIRSGYFLMAEVEPGPHSVAVRMARGGKSTEAALDVEVAEGRNAVIHVLFEMGAITGSSKMTPIEEAKAAETLAGAKMMTWSEGA